MSKRRQQLRVETTPSRPARSPMPFLMGALLALLVFAAYRPAVSGTFLWDDDDYVAQNPTLRTADGLAEIWFAPSASPQYYPMVFTTFWLEYRLWGDDPRGYHEVNVLLHAASAILLWRVLRRLRVPGAYLAAALFAAHPVMVESVAWITERKNTLSMLFYLASLEAYLRFARVDDDDGNEPADVPPNWKWYALSLAFFLFALGSKTVTASLPAAILLILWWKGHVTRRHVALLLPFFALGIASGVYTAYLERSHVGAAGPEWSYSVAERVLIAGRALWFYLAKLLVPYQLTFVYAKWPVRTSAVWQWLFPIAAVGLVVALFLLRKRLGRGPLVAVLIFGGTLVPALGFVNVYPMRYTFVADHYQYHAAAAMLALVAAALCRGFESARPLARWGRGLAAALVLVLAVLTWRRAGIYVDRQTLWTDTLAKSPNSWMAWSNLGHVAASKVPPDKAAAVRAYEKALELAPDVGDTHYNVGVALADAGDMSAAQREFARAVELEPRQASFHNMLGYTLAAQGQTDAAIAAYERALKADPRHPRAHFNLGITLRDKGDLDAAAEHFALAADLDPNHRSALRELANYHIRARRYAEAVDDLTRLVARDPNNAEAHFDLGSALTEIGRRNEGQAEKLKALSLKPELQRMMRQR